MPERPTTDHHETVCEAFRWQVPARFNMAEVCSRRWAANPRTKDGVAVIACDAQGKATHHTYAELQAHADAWSAGLLQLGVQRGDRVAIVLQQRFETAVAYMAVMQIGAVAMPLSVLFGPDALLLRLRDSAAVLAITDDASQAAVLAVQAECPALRSVLSLSADGSLPAWAGQPDRAWRPADTRADDAAILIYTSGTTGPPKGALIPHRALIGNLTGFVCSQNWFGFDGRTNQSSDAVLWSPADWAWTGGLMDALLPTLYFGRPIVAYRGRFSAEVAFELMQRHQVTHTFLFPTALKLMMKAVPEPRQRYQLALRAIMSAGEAVGDAVFSYCQDQLGVTVNEMFGQTEINYIVGNCHPLWPAKPGSMGKGYPGHRVSVIDEQGQECPVGVVGDVAVHRRDRHGHPDPIFFLGYWNNEGATSAKYTGDWCRTGDLAQRDADGYLWYQGRADDVFKSAGYRIGPSEVENCLVRHPAVANAAVVPKPDAERGALVKAYVVLAPGHAERRPTLSPERSAFDAALVQELQQHVKGRLAPYEYPKDIEFIDALPMTTTGKVQRRVLRLQEEERARALLRPASPS